MKKITERKLCNKCDCGELVSTGASRTNSFATYYDHRCKDCGAEATLVGTFFPRVFYEFDDNECEDRFV